MDVTGGVVTVTGFETAVKRDSWQRKEGPTTTMSQDGYSLSIQRLSVYLWVPCLATAGNKKQDQIDFALISKEGEL